MKRPACDDGDTTSPLSPTMSLALNDAACLTMSAPITPTTPGPTPTTPTQGRNMAAHDMTEKGGRDSDKSRSRASSTSQRATRSASSSTAGNSRRPGTGTGAGAGNATGVHRRTTSFQTQQPMSPQRRDQLLALHRDSCRLFQPSNVDPRALAPTDTRSTLSPFVSPTTSPMLQSQRSHSLPFGVSADSDISDEDLLPSPSPSSSHSRYYRRTGQALLQDPSINTVPEKPEHDNNQQQQQQQQQQQEHIAATVTEWTSPSTRRREYEEIDRSNRGIRRILRHLTPSCFQSEDSMRTPFWEEGSSSKKKNKYEGSVRRFRMDIPDDDDVDENENENESKVSEKNTTATTAKKVRDAPESQTLVSGAGTKGRWSCF